MKVKLHELIFKKRATKLVGETVGAAREGDRGSSSVHHTTTIRFKPIF